MFEGGVRAPPSHTYSNEPTIVVPVVAELKALIFGLYDQGYGYSPVRLEMQGENDPLVQVFTDPYGEPNLPQEAFEFATNEKIVAANLETTKYRP